MKKLTPTLLLSSLALFAGCDRAEKDGAAVQSLDNFARSSDEALVQNSCSGSFSLADGLEEDAVTVSNEVDSAGRAQSLRSQTLETLRSVPTPLQAAFVKLGGRVEVTPRTHEICTQNLDEADQEYASEGIKGSVKSCWKIEDREELVIYIDDARSAVRHSTVRSFGYILTQILVNLEVDSASGEIVWRDGANPAFEGAKEDVAVALLNDVDDSSGYDLGAFEDLLGREVLEASAESRETLSWSSRSRQRFADYAFAEALDSYYCSHRTRKVMKADFPESYERFQAIAERLESLPATAEEARRYQGGGAGFGLTQTMFLDKIIGLLGNLFGGGGGGGGLGNILGGLLGGGGGGGGGGGLGNILGGLLG